MCLGGRCVAQYSDSSNVTDRLVKLEADLLYMKQNTNHIQMHLKKCNDVYVAGTRIALCGLVATTVGTILLSSFSKPNSIKTGLALIGIGGGVTGIGGLVMLISHNHIGEASKKVKLF